jgi:hypothetical protein
LSLGQPREELQHVGTENELLTPELNQPETGRPGLSDGVFLPLQPPPQLGQ